MTETKLLYSAIVVRLLDYMLAEGKLLDFLSAAKSIQNDFVAIHNTTLGKKLKQVVPRFMDKLQAEFSNPKKDVGAVLLEWLQEFNSFEDGSISAIDVCLEFYRIGPDRVVH